MDYCLTFQSSILQSLTPRMKSGVDGGTSELLLFLFKKNEEEEEEGKKYQPGTAINTIIIPTHGIYRREDQELEDSFGCITCSSSDWAT